MYCVFFFFLNISSSSELLYTFSCLLMNYFLVTSFSFFNFPSFIISTLWVFSGLYVTDDI